MSIERTFSIHQTQCVAKSKIGAIIDRFESQGLRVAAAKLVNLDKKKAEGFYGEHKERPFFPSLISFMTSGPVLMMVLEGENAILKNREIMGPTDPAKAGPGTIRKDFGEGIEANAAHGSDSPAAAEREIAYFFFASEIVNSKL